MDIDKGSSFSNENNFQVQGSWIPGTPVKPILSKSQPIYTDRQGNQPGQANWLESERFSSGFSQESQAHGRVACYDSPNCMQSDRGINNWDAALSGRIHVSNDTVGTCWNSTTNPAAELSNISFTDHLAFADAASTTSTSAALQRNVSAISSPFLSSLHRQLESNQLESSSASLLLASQDLPLGSNLWINNNCTPEIPQYGLSNPYQHYYDLNSLPSTIADAVSSRTIPPVAPVTPDKPRGVENNQVSEISYTCIDEQTNQETNTQENGVANTGVGVNELHYDKELSQPVTDSSFAAVSTQLMENHNPDKGGNHIIDLNKTPQQKQRRKKHRPKVVTEGKPKRTPKLVTPKSTGSKETPTGKRKYVRRNGQNKPPTTPPPAEEIEGTTDPKTIKPRRKSCRLALNFDLENQAQDNSSCRSTFNSNSESQAQNLCTGSTQSKSTVQLTQGMEVTVETTQVGIAYDLNCYMNKMLKDYMSLPVSQAPSIPAPSKTDSLQEILKADAQNENSTTGKAQATSHDRQGNCVQRMSKTDNQLAPRSPNDSNCSTSAGIAEGDQARGLKREHSHTIGQAQLSAINMMGSHYNSLQAYQTSFRTNEHKRIPSMHFPEIFKKKRTEKVPISTTSNTQSSVTEAKMVMRQATACHQNDCKTNCSALKDNCCISASQLTTSMVPTMFEVVRGGAQDRLPTFQCIPAQGQPDRLTRKRTSGHTRARDLVSLNGITGCKQQPSFPAILARKKRTKKKNSLGNSVSLGTNEAQLQEINVVYGHEQFFAQLKGSLEAEKKRMLSIDAIVEQLKHLNINGESNKFAYPEQKALIPYNIGNQESNALVLYGRDGTIVPFEGPFDPVRKRRPRPKVDLDEETNRVWKLLMGNINSEGVDGTDEEKAKWWEEERRVFRGRADSFIARMHLVQGDRRFSQWKGSVVDSVIGVFLTQNVSDHLSSSAFMSLAAHFPLKSKSNSHRQCYEGASIVVEDPEVCILDPEDTIEWNEKMSNQPVCDRSSITLYNTELNEEKEAVNSNESFGSSSGGVSSIDNPKCQSLDSCESAQETSHESTVHTSSTQIVETKISCLAGDRRAMDDAILSQNYVVLAQNSLDSSIALNAERIGSCSESNSEAEELTTGSKVSNFHGSNSFMKLLQMAGATRSHEIYSQGSSNMLSGKNSGDTHSQSEFLEYGKQRQNLDRFRGPRNSTEVHIIPSSNYHLHLTPNSGILEVECIEMMEENRSFDISRKQHEISLSEQSGLTAESVSQTTVQKRLAVNVQQAPRSFDSSRKQHENSASEQSVLTADSASQTTVHKRLAADVQEAPRSSSKNNHLCNSIQVERSEITQSQSKQVGDPENVVESLISEHNNSMQQNPILPIFSEETLDGTESTSLLHNQKHSENMAGESNLKEHKFSSGKSFNMMNSNTLNAKKGRVRKEQAEAFDWDSLRKEAEANGKKRERTTNTMDSLDWEAVRCADVNEIANTIKERGMNNMLAERIKDFLNRLVREHGSTDLEWLRDVPPDKAKEYLLSVRGLGLKSVECVRLLTLHHLAFPVDTNVGRIAVRLGWVPLQPLPESLQLHLLELYPVLESIQKYLWPRLCKLDQRTLYELHYQMITFGKVFCTKSKPNCNACPMRGECRHFASAFASARLALPGPEEKSIVSATANRAEGQEPAGIINPLPLPLPQANPQAETKSEISNCEPIIEVPATPEPEYTEKSECDIEDTFCEDPDEIPTIKLNIEEFTQNLQNYMQENMELQEGYMSKALVALTPEAASIPMPKLKNVSRLRTEHQVYELPDSHPLLKGLDEREPDDPCSYLLAIWTPGETANSIQPPERRCSSQEFGKLCDEKTCFACNSIREANSQTVRGTLLIPCRTAMRGSFPLNGTYFQVNEVFADHDSSLNPIDVPRSWIWNLPRRTVYFGTSIPTIFKGLSTEGIQHCFWRGYVCVRGFHQKTRAPRPLMARLHFPASKLNRGKGQAYDE